MTTQYSAHSIVFENLKSIYKTQFCNNVRRQYYFMMYITYYDRIGFHKNMSYS